MENLKLEVNFNDGIYELYHPETATLIETTLPEIDEFIRNIDKPEKLSGREKDEWRNFSDALFYRDSERVSEIANEFFNFHYEKRKPCYDLAWSELDELQKMERINLEVAERNSELYKQKQAG